MPRLWLLLALIALPEPAYAAEPFVGRWAVSPAVCSGFGSTSATAPLIAGTTTLRWYSGVCQIGKMYKLGAAVYIQARCFGDRATDIPIMLEPRGDRMRVTWNGGKLEELQRCP